MKKKRFKKIPVFDSDEQESTFWASHDSTEYVDWSQAKQTLLPNLKPSTRTISIRLPVLMIEQLKTLAHAHDVPYQSFMKILLAQSLQRLHPAGVSKS